MIRVVSAATPNGGKGISGATDGEIYECLSASFPAFYLVVSGKKRNFAVKLYVELNEWRMKQVEERYISLLTNFGFDRLFEEAEIAKFTPQEMREYETSKMAYRDIKNSVDTAKREFGNLKLIKDSHPKYVISMDRLYSQTNIDGIKHIHLRDFLKMTTLV